VTYVAIRRSALEGFPEAVAAVTAPVVSSPVQRDQR
jgi:hypothetical protein